MTEPAPRITSCHRGGFQDRPGIWLAFAYDEAWVETLKAKVPHTDRTWDAQQKRWWVAEEHEALVRKLFPSVAAYLDQKGLPI